MLDPEASTAMKQSSATEPDFKPLQSSPNPHDLFR
jgi:hypothetical protein